MIHHVAHKGDIFYAGEAAGFQDALFGFGMRWAMLSGTLAADAMMSDNPGQYEQALDWRLRKFMQASEVNRWFYERMGNRGYRAILNRNGDRDSRMDAARL